MKLDEAIGLYVRLRDSKKDLKDAYDESVADIDAKLAKLEQAFARHFEKTGQTSCKTDAGTAYTKKRVSATVKDRDAFLRFVLKNKAFDFLESKANKSAVEDYLEKNEEAPPGVQVSVHRVINVNRGRK